MTTGIVQTETRHPGGFMVSEANGRYSRDSVTIGQNQAIVAGQVLGESLPGAGTFAAAAAVPNGSNAGNGTVSAPTTAAGAQSGTYTVRAIAPLVWEVADPSGRVIGEARNAVAFNTQIGFTITAGGTAFAAGDQFTVAVTETDPADAKQYKALNLAATDGSQNALVISWGNYTTGAGQTMPATVVARDAEVRGVDLVWPAGISVPQLAAGIAQLAAVGIVVR